MGAALATGLLIAGGAHDAAAQSRDTTGASAAVFSPDDLLWLEVRAGDLQLAESMDAYAARGGVYLPLGQFSRVLDLAVGVFPAQGRAEGWILSRERRVRIELGEGYALVGDRRIPIGPGQAQVSGDEIYLRSDLMAQILPVRLSIDTSAQLMTVEALETLPYQSRLEREARARSLTVGGRAEATTRIPTPYAAFSAPAFDLNAGGQVTRDGSDNAQRFDVRASGDLLYGGVQAFVGSNDDGEISDVRLSWTRKDPDGRALGWLGGTRAGFGDVFSPSLPIGVAGFAGRGVFYTSAPIESLDIATPLNLRGELALGEEVELYVNEVLQAVRTSAEQGRYEFLDVPLTHGMNTVRLVFYGQQGQTREIVRRINFGAGQVGAGQFVMRFGAIEQGRNLIETGRESLLPDAGDLRLALQADYGVNERLTVSGGLGLYTPAGGEQRGLMTLGARGSLGGAALQLDVATDDQGGQGLTGGLSTRVAGLSLLTRHSEYVGGFIDETRQLGVTSTQALRRATNLRADWQVQAAGATLPVSVDAQRLERVDGEAASQVAGRIAAPLGGFYASTSLIWESVSDAPDSVLYGETDVASLVRGDIQVRGGLSYRISPEARLDTAYATLDMELSERQTLRLAGVRALATGETSLQAASLWRTDTFDVALNSAYETDSGDWRVGVQFSVSFGYDRSAGRYRAVRPGLAIGGSARLNAFVDENGDGVRQPGEEGVPGVVLETAGGAITSDDDGSGFVSGLGDGAIMRLRVDTSGIEDPFLVGGPTELDGTPRPGAEILVSYPMRRTAEVQALARVLREDGTTYPLAALDVVLAAASGEQYPARTDHAGVVYFEGVPPGTYQFGLGEQSAALGLVLSQPVSVTVEGGGFADAGELVVRVTGRADQ